MGELLVLIVGALLEFIGQILLQAVFELLVGGVVEVMKRAYRDGDERENRAIVLLYLLSIGLGCGAGALSLWAFPHLLVKTLSLRLLNLALTPFAVAALTALWFRRSWTGAAQFHGIGHAYVFALAVAAVRLAWGQ